MGAKGVMAKRAVQRYIGRKRHRSGCKVNFFELPCCLEHGQLQSSCDAMEKRICCGNAELGSVSRARHAELAQLGIEVSRLRHCVEHSSGCSTSATELTAEASWDEFDKLQRQLTSNKAALDDVRNRRLAAEKQ